MLLLFDDAQHLVKTHHCRQCGRKAMLVARAVPGESRLNVVCGDCGSDEHLERDKRGGNKPSRGQPPAWGGNRNAERENAQ